MNLEVDLRTVNEKVKFAAKAGDKPEISVDYFSPVGDGEGYTSLELLLVSFASCVGTTLLVVLRTYMHKNISSLSVNAKGMMREEHPRALSNIRLEMAFTSPDLEEEDIKKALVAAEEKLCPVWAMLKGNVDVELGYTVNRV